MSRTPLTPWQQFESRWGGGCGSHLCTQETTQVVLARGDVPCDVLFVGVAPGVGENTIGDPMVGPAGHLLDHDGRPPGIIQQAGIGGGRYKAAFCNLVCCMPVAESGDKDREPDATEVVQCSQRLREFIAACSPRLVVCVGALPEKWLTGRKPLVPEYQGGYASIRHPAHILRQVGPSQPLLVKECVVQLRNALVRMEEDRENPGGAMCLSSR